MKQLLNGEGVDAQLERMYPNKDGWLSVETVTDAGDRITVFHGTLDVSSPEARHKYQTSVREALHAHRAITSTMAAQQVEPVSLFQGRVVVSLPRAP